MNVMEKICRVWEGMIAALVLVFVLVQFANCATPETATIDESRLEYTRTKIENSTLPESEKKGLIRDFEIQSKLLTSKETENSNLKKEKREVETEAKENLEDASKWRLLVGGTIGIGVLILAAMVGLVVLKTVLAR